MTASMRLTIHDGPARRAILGGNLRLRDMDRIAWFANRSDSYDLEGLKPTTVAFRAMRARNASWPEVKRAHHLCSRRRFERQAFKEFAAQRRWVNMTSISRKIMLGITSFMTSVYAYAGFWVKK